MIIVARIISFLLNPIFVLLPIPYILVGKFSNDYSYALKWTLFSYLFTIIFAIFVAIGVKLGVFSNFDVSKRSERPLLFSFAAFTIFCYLLSLIILDGPKILFITVLALIFGLIVMLIVNKKIKASIHVAIITSFTLLISIFYGKYYYLLLLLIPVLSWSRVKTKRHTPMETLIGNILGVLFTLVMYFISKYFLVNMLYNR